MIEGCFNYAADNELPPLAVAVVDESGTLVGFRRQSGAAPLIAEAAILKARTVIQTGGPTSELASQAGDPTVRDAFILMHLTTLPGGEPLVRKDSSIRGAVGVSGADPAQDARCAQHAVESVTDNHRHGAKSAGSGKEIEAAVRRQLSAFELDWNRGDLQAVIAQYDPTLFAIWEPHYMGYEQYMAGIKKMFSGGSHPHFKLEVETIRALGSDYAVANGRAYTTFKDGRVQKEFFTVIYLRSVSQWRLIYSHSSFF